MPMIRLAGCRSDSLLGYLKALGVLRLLSAQADPTARGAWEGATFLLSSPIAAGAVEDFFLGEYRPTPVLGLWNNGAGFDGKEDTAGAIMQRIRRTSSARLLPYREALVFVTARYLDSGLMNRYLDDKGKIRKELKPELVRDIRARCPEGMLPWLDSSVLLAPDGLEFPYLMGSGGNDGHLDFSVNFAASMLDVCGDEPLAGSAQLLRGALFDADGAKLLPGRAIGQFSSRHAGGPNATAGFDAASLVNPWDYVLMVEGALLFSGSIGRRTDRAPGRPVFPFAFRGVAGGYGSASDEEQARGEIWLPVWDGFASATSIADLLRKGRVDLPGDAGRSTVRSAVFASDAAPAMVTLGVPLGIRSLERVAFVQRNGLAFSATSIGSIDVDGSYDQGVAVISRNLASWVERLRGQRLGISAREALRQFYDLMFVLPNIPAERRAATRQDILVAVADLDRVVGRTRAEVPEVPRLDAAVVSSLDDGSPVHRAALAIASLGAARPQTETRGEMREATDDPARTLRTLLERRTREAAKNPGDGWLLATCALSVDDVVSFLGFSRVERLRFGRLLRAYSLIRLAKANVELQKEQGEVPIPAAYAVLKLVFDNAKARDERILRLLFTGNAESALTLAVQRARTIRDLPRAPRDVSAVQIEDSKWTAAALALPVAHSVHHYWRLLNSALTARIPLDQSESIRAYLATLE